MLFVSNTKLYVPIILCRIAGSIHLFRIRGKLTIEMLDLKGKFDLGCSGGGLEKYQHDAEWK